MAVTFDKDRHTFRTDMFADYKATRKPAPPELIPQFDLILDVLAVTVGDEIEKASDAAFKSGDYVRGLLLDAAATTATEHLADQVDRLNQKEAAKDGQKTVWRFSPGYGDWPVTQQKDFCRLIEADNIGIQLTDHSMLFPRKSVSAIIGISQCSQRPAPAKCRTCSLLTCPFRH